MAAYDLAVATYRQTVLTGFQQVEDELVALRVLGQEASVEDEAVTAARGAVDVTLNEYRAGTVAYTSVITAQETLLADPGNRADHPSEPLSRQRGADPGAGRRLDDGEAAGLGHPQGRTDPARLLARHRLRRLHPEASPVRR